MNNQISILLCQLSKDCSILFESIIIFLSKCHTSFSTLKGCVCDIGGALYCIVRKFLFNFKSINPSLSTYVYHERKPPKKEISIRLTNKIRVVNTTALLARANDMATTNNFSLNSLLNTSN